MVYPTGRGVCHTLGHLKDIYKIEESFMDVYAPWGAVKSEFWVLVRENRVWGCRMLAVPTMGSITKMLGCLRVA